MVGRSIGSIVVGMLTVTLVAGCAKEIAGTPTGQANPPRSTTSAPANAAGSGTAMLGELRSIDACSLTDPAEFSEFGTSKFGVLDSLDECLVEIKTDAADPISVYVGHLDRAEAFPDIRGKKSRTLPGGLKVVDYESDAAYCSQLLWFPDGITMTVSAAPNRGTESKLCQMVTAGMDKAVAVIQDGQVRHRSLPTNTLAAINPCDIVPPEALAAVPNLGTVAPKSYPAKHNCLWATEDAVTGPRLRVMFAAGSPPKATAHGAIEVPIAGRTSVVSPGSSAGSNIYCFAETGHVPLQAEGQSGVLEKAYVSVRLPKDQGEAACKAAYDVAGLVWPRLPAP